MWENRGNAPWGRVTVGVCSGVCENAGAGL